jgi:trimethylamine monooxygenase
MNGPVRIAVIGAGPAGLSQLHAFQTKIGGLSNIEIVCYEKQNSIGGQWSPSVLDYNSSGEPKSSCMYKHLWSNGPKECVEYEDYTFNEHFKKPTASYLPREVLHDYILARAEKSDILKYVRLGMAVRWINFDVTQSHFTIHIEDLKTGSTKLELFNYVVVATGHFSVPNSPSCEGIETVSYS